MNISDNAPYPRTRIGRTYSPPAKQAVVSLPLVGLVRSSRSAFQPLLQRGQAMPQADIACAVGRHVLPEHQNSCETTSQLPAKTCHRQLCRRYGYRFSGDTHFLFAKSSTDFLIIFSNLRKCRNCLEYQVFPAFCVSEDTPHIMAYRSLIWQSKVVKP